MLYYCLNILYFKILRSCHFCHFLNSLRKTNTQAVEILYNDEWQQIEPAFKQIQSNREKLIDSEYLYSSLCGYMQGEVRLANGERQGDIGKKRRSAIEKYGFSPKNWVNLFRLAYCGVYFFDHGVYPTNFVKYWPKLGKQLYDLKNNPERYQLADLQQLYLEAKQDLDEAYAVSTVHFKFSPDLANQILLDNYLPILTNYSQDFK